MISGFWAFAFIWAGAWFVVLPIIGLITVARWAAQLLT